jgi:hypothetical protein
MTNHYAIYFPKIKAIVRAAFDAAFAAEVISTKGGVFSYDEWPDSFFQLPAAVIGTRDGDQTYGLGSPAIATDIVGIWLYLNGDMNHALAMKQGTDLRVRIRDGLAGSITLDGTVVHCLPPDPPARFYQGPGEMIYAGKQYVGILFSLHVKLNESGTLVVSA